jgi:putative sterol carrier protein
VADTWSIRLLRAALKVQSKVTSEVSTVMKVAGSGRKARILIEGEDGGEIFLRWTGERLTEEDNSDDVRNDFIIHAQTLFDLATGEIGAREALAARLIMITGDRSIYDQEDIIKLFEKLQQILVLQLQQIKRN